jgi:acyl-CoA dehydrogenase
VRRFVEQELYPHAAEWEHSRWFPNEVFGRLAQLGYLGLTFPPEYGGDGDPVAHSVFVEELARCGSGGVAAGIGAHTGIALPPIWRFGTEEQKRRYLVAGIRGEKIAALAITEPDAGSDVASLRTIARKIDGGYLVSGSKMFITGGVRADVIVTAVRTTPEGGHHGLSFLLVERGPGVQARPIEKLGWHASDTALITFDEVFVPEENLLGEENGGFYLIMANFQWERLLMALGAVGAMQVAFEKTLRLASERVTSHGQRDDSGRPEGAHQAIRHKLAEIATTIEASRDVTYSALRRYLTGEDAVREVTIAKLATQRAAFEVTDTCLQIHGGEGYLADHDIERAARDARLGPIGGGTDEIMKEVLGRSLGL